MTFQIVDTPGILDKPLSKRSKVELLSISAFGRLSNVIAFIVDVSEGNEFSLESQRGLYDDVAGALKDTPMKVILQQVDRCPQRSSLPRRSPYSGSGRPPLGG